MKKGFTLIELIVVIGILGILMAVLIGSFSGSTESARAAKCLANMRSLAVTVQSYGMENGYFPYAGSLDQYKFVNKQRTTVQAPGWISWSSEGASGSYISPYDENDEAREFSLTNGCLWASMKGSRDSYVCPEHIRYSRDRHKPVMPLWSYAMNAYFHWQGKGVPRYQKWHGWGFRSFKRPDRHLLFAELPYADVKSGDMQQAGQISGAEEDPVLQYNGCEGSGQEVIGFNHKSGREYLAHVCFADGHVEKLRMPKSGDLKELTAWLCRPSDDDGDFDISFDGKQYQKVR